MAVDKKLLTTDWGKKVMNNRGVDNLIAKNLEMWIIFRILVGWVGGRINRENQQEKERLFGPCGARTKIN